MFILSLLFILFSSYLILSVIDKKTAFKNNLGLIFFILIAFSQIILTFEVLSLFRVLSKNSVFISNIIFLLISILIWSLIGKSCYKPLIFEELKKIFNALKKDKILIFISFCFLVFIISTLIIALFFPIRYADALSYYFSRCSMWVQNMGISHYLTLDSRELIMPVNSEILYTWVFLFLKNEIGTGIFPYIFYINAVYVLYNLLGELGFCRRKRLWSVFVFSSFPLVYIESSIPGGDLWCGSLILTGIYLFLCACKYNKKIIYFFSALAYALAVGLKTTAIIAFPSVLILIIMFAYLYNKKKAKASVLRFLSFFFINFLVFSSYIYFLNWIDFNNPISDKSQLLLNSFRGGLKGYIFNLVHYIFIMFDFSGIPDFINLGILIEKMQNKFLALIGIGSFDYMSPFFPIPFRYNSEIGITKSLLGFIGILTFYPAIVYSLMFGIKRKLSRKSIILFLFAISYLFNILIFSRVMVYTKFNMRYLLTFVVIAAPILVYTYIRNNKNIMKWILCLLLFINLAFIPHAKPLSFIIGYIKNYHFANTNETTDRSYILKDFDEAAIRRYFLTKNKCNIGLMLQMHNYPLYYIKKLSLDGYNLYTVLPEIITEYDLKKFDYLIISKSFITSNIIKNFKTDTNIPNISECIYKNYKKEIITPAENQIPATVVCLVPIKYILENGFEITQDINLNSYWILKNKNNM